MKFRYEESTDRWLDENGFNEAEKIRLLELLNKLEKDLVEKKKGPLVVLPKDTPDKLAAMVMLLNSVNDKKDCLACFTDQKTVVIPLEARALYSEGMGIQELERTLKLADKVKMGRSQMYPKRRGNAKS